MIDFEKGRNIFGDCGLDYSKEIHEKLSIYCEFLIEYNQRVNLTAITDPEQVWLKHFADSILLEKYIEIPDGASIIDIGTGAGFPSVPLKIMRDDVEINLLDSLNKRIIFLEKLCSKLGIKAELIHGRAEEYGKNDRFREKFDVAIARAVAAMPTLCEYCMPFVKTGGVFAAMKGPNEVSTDSEKAVEILGGKEIEVFDYSIGGGEKRRIFSVKKISHTPTKYPRNSSQIKNKSL